MSARKLSALVRDEDQARASNCRRPEGENQPSLLDYVYLPPPGGRYGYGCSRRQDFSQVVNSIHMQLQFFLGKVDGTVDCFIHRQGRVKRDVVVTGVQNLLYTCQPFFNHLENITRSTVAKSNPLPAEICTKLLDFSQQLCDKLEQMLLRFASYNLLSLDDKQPHSVSQFCIGQCQLGQLKLTTFRYCVPMQYISPVNMGLYKRMRWNVERLHKDNQGETETDYYFLCCQDSYRLHRETDVAGQHHDDLKRTWSIGQWMQVYPDPNSDDINEWIICDIPLANYHMLLYLGEDEPSSCKATDSLMKLLLTLQKTD